ncbi:MAG: DivIVA domain-containing protein [Clostridiales bacterium]|nr:DivIVA domain-containing protein [Clostridiales bacterium]
MERDDVINKVFPHSLFGYDPVAVDAFLDEVIRELDRKNNTIDVLRLKLAQELGEAQDVNTMLASTMQREGFLKRAEELIKVSTVAETEAVPEPAEEPVSDEPAAEEEPPEEPETEPEEPEASQPPEEPAESDEIEQMII